MKQLLYVFAVILMVSCGSSSPDKTYENTITEYLLKGSDTMDNLDFKVIELSEQGELTVADSIAYLTDEFRKDKQVIIDRLVLGRKMSEDLQENTLTKKDQESYEAGIATINSRIDSLENLVPDNLQGYESRNASDVIVKIVRCKYSIVPPGGTAVEETFDFYLSADGTKCYGKKRA